MAVVTVEAADFMVVVASTAVVLTLRVADIEAVISADEVSSVRGSA